MLRWIYWKNDKNRYKIYGKNDKTTEKASKMCSETYFLVSGKREKRSNINFLSQKLAYVRNIWTTLLYILNTCAKRTPYWGKEKIDDSSKKTKNDSINKKSTFVGALPVAVAVRLSCRALGRRLDLRPSNTRP